MAITRLMLAIALLLIAGQLNAASLPKRYNSAATNNATLVQRGKLTLNSVHVVNSTAVVRYLKLYDAAEAPLCGTATPVWVVQVPASASVSLVFADPLSFNNGIGFCLVNGVADSDNTAAATGLIVNLGIVPNA